MSKQCKIIEDLLPLYVDNACSRESAEMIREHLAECAECRTLYESMYGRDDESALRREKNAVIARHEHREALRVVYCILTAVVLLYLALLFILPLLADDSASIIALPYYFLLLGLALLTLPYCVAFVGLVTSVCLLLEGRRRTVGERVLGWLVAAMSGGCILAQAYSLTVVSTFITAALMVIGVIRAVKKRKYRIIIDILRQKLLWVCFAALALLAALVMVVGVSMATDHRREDTIEQKTDNYLFDESVMVINDLAELDACRERLLTRYEQGDPIVVLDATAAYEVQALTRRNMAVTLSDGLQAAIFYTVNGTPATWELCGNSSELWNDINEALRVIRSRQAAAN